MSLVRRYYENLFQMAGEETELQGPHQSVMIMCSAVLLAYLPTRDVSVSGDGAEIRGGSDPFQ